MDTKDLILNGRKYISSRRAAEISGYTIDYLGQLARGGKFDSTMVGRTRYFSEISILSYIDEVEKLKNQGSGAASSESHVSLPKKEIKIAPRGVPFSITRSVDFGRPVSSASYYSKTNDLENNEEWSVGFYHTLALFPAVVFLLVAFFISPLGQSGLAQLQTTIAFEISGYERNLIASVPQLQPVANFLKMADEIYIGALQSIETKIVTVASVARKNILAFFEDHFLALGPSSETRMGRIERPSKTTPGVSSEGGNASTTIVVDLDEQAVRDYVREILLEESDVFAPEPSLPRAGVITFPIDGKSQDAVIRQQIQNSFSDEVDVLFDPTGTTGVLRPIFRNATSTFYSFIVVPINE